jgi:hypothetical protein
LRPHGGSSHHDASKPRPQSAGSDQLALAVEPSVTLTITERRGGDERSLRVGPLPEPQARALAALLLNRADEPPADGPWRLAVGRAPRPR